MPRRTWLSRLLWTLAALVALPHVLIAVYLVLPPPATPLMLWRAATGHGLERDWVPLDDIAPALPLAVIASEDSRFCAHWGVDWRELAIAFEDWRAGGRLRGASTVSMQLARNLFLWPGRDPVRKAAEIWLALVLDLAWPKRRIMEVYLNVVEWGPGLYGAGPAARRYFDRPPRDLDAAEAALLAAVLPNPRGWRPDRPTAQVSARAETARARMAGLGRRADCVAR